MRLYYLDESEGNRYYIRSALGINAEVWSEVFSLIKDWRKQIKTQYHVPMHKELHAYELLHGKGLTKFENRIYTRLSKEEGHAIFASGLHLLETISEKFGKQIEVINVALKKADFARADIISLEKMLNRIHSSCSKARRYSFCVFDEGKEVQITKFYRKVLIYNPIPSRYGSWESGEPTKHIPPYRIVGNPAFRRSRDDYFIQAIDFVAHALLKKYEEPTPRIIQFAINKDFDILDKCLNKLASSYNPQGVVTK